MKVYKQSCTVPNEDRVSRPSRKLFQIQIVHERKPSFPRQDFCVVCCIEYYSIYPVLGRTKPKPVKQSQSTMGRNYPLRNDIVNQ